MRTLGLQKAIEANIIKGKNAKVLMAELKSAKNTVVNLSKNKAGIAFIDKSSKKPLETQNLFKNGELHGIPVPEAVITFIRGVKTQIIMLLDNAFIIEKSITKNPQKGFVRVETALRMLSDESNQILSYKRKTARFETDGGKFLKHKYTHSESFDSPEFSGFWSLENLENYFDTPKFPENSKPPKTIEEAGKLLDKLVNKRPQTDSSDIRKRLANELLAPQGNVFSYFQEFLGHKGPMSYTLKDKKFGGQALVFKDNAGQIVETHNIFNRILGPNYHGIPMSHCVNLFFKDYRHKSKTVLEPNLFIDRIIQKYPKSGRFEILTSLTRVNDGNVEVISQIHKNMKFEVENGKFKRLLSRFTTMIDQYGYKGFSYKKSNGKYTAIKFHDTKGIHKELDGLNLMDDLANKPINTVFKDALYKNISEALRLNKPNTFIS